MVYARLGASLSPRWVAHRQLIARKYGHGQGSVEEVGLDLTAQSSVVWDDRVPLVY